MNDFKRTCLAPLLIAAYWLTPSSAFAQVSSPKPDPIDASAEIGAQVSLTRDAIEQMLRSLAKKPGDRTFRAADYLEQLPAFQRQIEQGMEQFQSVLSDTILKQVGFWMDRYNQVQLSSQFSSEQKKVLGEQIRTQIDAQMKGITARYHEEIRKAYGLAGALPRNYQYVFKPGKAEVQKGLTLGCAKRGPNSKSFRGLTYLVLKDLQGQPVGETPVRCVYYGKKDDYWVVSLGITARAQELIKNESYDPSETYPCRASKDASSNLPRVLCGIFEQDATLLFLDDSSRLYFENFFPAIAGSCRSQICLGLRASDVSTYLGLVATTLDRTLTFRLADGTSIQLPKLGFEIGLATWFLARVDYPSPYQNMPFDTE